MHPNPLMAEHICSHRAESLDMLGLHSKEIDTVSTTIWACHLDTIEIWGVQQTDPKNNKCLPRVDLKQFGINRRIAVFATTAVELHGIAPHC